LIELREALAETCEEAPNEDMTINTSSKYFKLLSASKSKSKSKTNSKLAEKSAHLMPDHIWNMDGVNSNRIFFKQVLIKRFGDWKNSSDDFFAQDCVFAHSIYETALFHYRQSLYNELILKRAHQLYEKKSTKYHFSISDICSISMNTSQYLAL
jgi:hypothetical protein